MWHERLCLRFLSFREKSRNLLIFSFPLRESLPERSRSGWIGKAKTDWSPLSSRRARDQDITLPEAGGVTEGRGRFYVWLRSRDKLFPLLFRERWLAEPEWASHSLHAWRWARVRIPNSTSAYKLRSPRSNPTSSTLNSTHYSQETASVSHP
jgi:hypothetical protein